MNRRIEAADAVMPRSPALHVLGRSVCIALFSLTLAPHPALGADLTVEQVRSAWESRRQSIKSFQYEYWKEIPEEDAVLRKTFTFSLSDDKMASRVREERQDISSGARKEVNSKSRAAFDSACYREVTEFVTPRRSMGILVPSVTPGDMLTAHVNSAGIWFWYSPIARLKKVGYDPEKMTLSRPHVLREGRDCAELSIPTTNGRARLLVYVDPSRDCLPVELIGEMGGAVQRKISIQYVRNDRVGWRVAAWSDTLSGVGSFEVEKCSINEPLSDDLFAFDFPKDTHVVENPDAAAKYFIALENGKRRYVTQAEFGVPPGGRTRPEAAPGKGQSSQESGQQPGLTPDSGGASSSGAEKVAPSWIGWAGVLCGLGFVVVIQLVFFVWRRVAKRPPRIEDTSSQFGE